jgi:predicted double-glycine peptidase
VKRRNPRGEWWIDESGRVEFADQDVAGLGHEAQVREMLVRLFLDKIDARDDSEFVGTLNDHSHEVISYLVGRGVSEEKAEGDPANELHPILKKKMVPKQMKPEQFEDAYWTAWGSTQRDARLYAMKWDSWKRVAGNNVETWTLTAQDLKAIADGLAEIYEQDGVEEIPTDDEFNIEVRATKKYYTGVPWSAVDSGDVSEVTRGRADNPRRRNPDHSFERLGGEEFAEGWLDSAKEIRDDRHHDRPHARYDAGGGRVLHVVTRSEGRVVEWALTTRRGGIMGGGAFGVDHLGTPQEFGVAFAAKWRGKGLHRTVLRIMRDTHFQRPIESDQDRSFGNASSWRKAGGQFHVDKDRYRINPPLPHEPTDLSRMRYLAGFRPARQLHNHTCGPACLRAVLAWKGAFVHEDHLAKVARTTKAHGTTPADMARTLASCGRRPEIKRGATVAWCLRQLRQDRPVLLLWNDWKGHWVVLVGYDGRGRLLFADPANRKTGLRVHTIQSLNKHWRARVAGKVYRRLAIAVG